MLTLDLGLDIVDGVRGLHLKGDSLARNCAAVSTFSCRYVVGDETHGS